MARGPYQGTWQPNIRPTVVHSPDALVYINGEADLISCPGCKKRFDLSKYITSIQVDLNIDSVPGSATINLSIPRHAIDDFMFDGVPIISPMMEIEIYAKGYYLLEGLPQYYPIFWGLVTEVGDGYSGGEHTVTIQCNDILKWWELCKMNINPAFTAPSGQLGRNLFGNVFFGMNPYDIIFTLAHQSFGDVVIGTGSLTSLYQESAQKSTFNAALGDIMVYWNERFGRIRSNLMMYGVNGVAVRGADLSQTYQTSKLAKGAHVASAAVRNANGKDKNNPGQLVFDPTSENVVAFRTQGLNAGQVNFWQSEYQTKLELANAAKEAIGFEFYMDVTGDIVFKPPFYNLDVLSNKPVSWIQDIDIIDWDFSDSEAEVVTQLTIQGNFTGNIDWGIGEEATPYTSVTDYHLLRKYGWRSHTYNSEFMADPRLMFYHGLDILDRINSKRHRASISIPLRPELRLGFPVYVGPKDQVWYLQGISHNIQFGGRATTTLQLTARRGKFVAPKGIGSLKMTGDVKPPKQGGSSPTSGTSPKELSHKKFTLDVGKAASLPGLDFDPQKPETVDAYAPLILRHPKTGRLCGFPNVVMVYTKPFTNISLEQWKQVSGSGDQSKQVSPTKRAALNSQLEKNYEQQIAAFTDENVEKLTKAHNANRWHYGLNSAGVFIYAHETEKVVNQFSLLPVTNLDVKIQGEKPDKKNPIFNKGSAMIRPVSDERGFEVIGHFRYGRGISLRDGRLTLSNGVNDRTDIGVQLALSGDLFASLQAQSQGLTTVATVYPNPADAVARLQPDDLQTAATITPGKGAETAQFVNTEENFVDAAPLGSPEAQGLPVSVEAGQLSRALTLAEMSVKEDQIPGDEACGCAVRSDLAFINVGYSVKTVNPANPETNLFGNATLTGTPTFGDAQQQLEIATGAAKPAELKFDNIRDKVEDYLWTLYDALDKDHHEYEQALRGGLREGAHEGRFDPERPVNQQFGDFSPPFSPEGRAPLGDPVATAMQASSAADNLKRTWQNYGEKLRKQSEGFGQATEVLQLKNQLTDTQKQLSEAQKATPVNQARVDQLNAQASDLRQRIHQLEAQIGVNR